MLNLSKMEEKTNKKALMWSFFWVFLAGFFNLFVYFYAGKEKALEFLAGYLIEKSLSVDNVFVFSVIFSFFKIPQKFQKRVLFHGVAAALVFRFFLIFLGLSTVQRFVWVMYVLGAFLLLTGLTIVLKKEKSINPSQNFIFRWLYRKFNVTDKCEKEIFFLRKAGKFFVTPLFLALLTIEGMDLVFALDSIPAIFAVTKDPLIVYSSNVFAILGLRSLYAVLAGYTKLFQFFKRAIGLVLVFVGIKILMGNFYHISTGVSLIVIASIFLTWFIWLRISER